MTRYTQFLYAFLGFVMSISSYAQPPNWPPPGNGPPNGIIPGQQPCWPPPCVPTGKYLPIALVITAIIMAIFANKKFNNKK